MANLALPLALLVAGAAWAQRLELLGPSGFVSPDGFEVAVRRIDGGGRSAPAPEAALGVEGGEATRTERGFLVVARPGSRQVKLKAQAGGLSAEGAYPVGPPAARISLQLVGAPPVKNRDSAAELTVEVLGPDGKPDPLSATPVLRANVGAIEALARVAPGRYRARYLLPTTLFPEVAVVVAFSAWPHPQSVHGAIGALRVPLASAVELPGQTEKNADFSIVIAGKKFGPVRAGADGRFKVPVVVPPGYGKGQGTAVDQLGNRRVTAFDLQLPPTDQLACVLSPTRLPADGSSRARVLCATSDPFGNAATGAKVQLTAARGTLSPSRALENGVVEWTLIAPRELSEKPVTLSASWRQGTINAQEELAVQLLQGPAVQARVQIDEPLVHLGSQGVLAIDVADALGRPRPGGHTTVTASSGQVGAPITLSEARLQVEWKPAALGSATLTTRAWGPAGVEPARLVAWAEAGALWAAATDLAGLPVPAQALKVGATVLTTDAQGVARLGELADGAVEIAHSEWPALTLSVHVREGGRWVFPGGARPGSAPQALALTVAPAVPVNVRVAARGAEVTYWVESPRGEVLAGRAVAVTLSSGTVGSRTEAAGRTRLVVRGLTGPASISVVDVETQVIGVAQVGP